MYLYKRAVGISKIVPRGEELLDISTIKTNELLNLYDNLLIVVGDAIALRDVVIDSESYRNEFFAFDGYIQEWLDANASVQLTTSNTLPSDEYRFVTTHDIQYEWFSLLPGDATLGDDRQSDLTPSGGKDIRVKRTDRINFDYVPLVERALWTINGHFVRAVPGTDCLFLLNAGRHFNVNNNIHVNCLNFNTVSNVQTLPIQESDVRFTGEVDHSTLHYKSPVSLKNKTVWMVIAGRLYFNDVIKVRGDNSVLIRTDKVDWFSRIFDSKDYIDLSGIIEKERMVVGDDFFKTEEFFTKLMTDVSSFLVILDNPHVFVETKPVVTYLYPFTYHTEETRNIPLITGGGLLPKYFTRSIINRRLLDTDIGIQRNYVNKTTGSGNEGSLLHGFTNRKRPSHLHRGYLLYIRGVLRMG